MEKPDEVQIESIKLGNQLILYCPVFSKPLPDVNNFFPCNAILRFLGN